MAFSELSMSHAQRSEGLCSRTFCSCCIRGRTTDRFGRCCCCCNARLSPDAVLNTITHNSVWEDRHKCWIAVPVFASTFVSFEASIGTAQSIQNPSGAEFCGDAALDRIRPQLPVCRGDSQRASLGLHHHASFSSFQQHTKANKCMSSREHAISYHPLYQSLQIQSEGLKEFLTSRKDRK